MLLLAAIATAMAEEPATIVTDRPDIAESSIAVGSGTYQVEQGLLAETVDGQTSISFPSLHRFGLGHNLEFRVETPILSASAADQAFDGVAVGFKWHVQDGGELGEPPSLALYLHGDIGPDGEVLPIAKALIDTSLPGDLEVGINVGGTLTPGDREPEFNYAVALGRFLNDTFRVYAEGSGANSLNAREFGVDAGVSLLLTDNVQWDMSARQSFQGGAGWYIGSGISARFMRKS